MLDMPFIQETKLDDSFPKCQFDVPSFKMYRHDQRSNRGGMTISIRNDMARKRREELQKVYPSNGSRSEVMVKEVVLTIEKW